MASPIRVTLEELGLLVDRVDRREVAERDWPIIQELVTRFQRKQRSKWLKYLALLEQGGAGMVAFEPSFAGDGGKTPTARHSQKKVKAKSKGHGKRAAGDYTEAQHHHYKLNDFHNGQHCPHCKNGRFYQEREARIIRIVGQAPLEAHVHHIEKARCRLCGAAMHAPYSEKAIAAHVSGFDYMACAILVVYHYLGGLPFKRLETMLSWLHQRTSDARIWDMVNQVDDRLLAVYRAHEKEQIDEATSVRFDDTGAKINLLRKEDEKRAINASVFYFDGPLGQGVLFYTGAHHAGEIFTQILAKRDKDRGLLIRMADGAAKNFVKSAEDHHVIDSVCNSHAYRKFKDQKANAPEEFAYVKAIYEQVYENDAYAREHDLAPEARLAFHKEHSTEPMERLRNWAIEKIKAGNVESNSPLGEALGYLSNQWRRLTEFLKTPGVPLDTNLAEQVVKVIIRYRNNSRSYQNELGAQVGDRMMSLAYSAILMGRSPIDYVKWCLDNSANLSKDPHSYTPRAYDDALGDELDGIDDTG